MAPRTGGGNNINNNNCSKSSARQTCQDRGCAKTSDLHHQDFPAHVARALGLFLHVFYQRQMFFKSETFWTPLLTWFCASPQFNSSKMRTFINGHCVGSPLLEFEITVRDAPQRRENKSSPSSPSFCEAKAVLPPFLAQTPLHATPCSCIMCVLVRIVDSTSSIPQYSSNTVLSMYKTNCMHAALLNAATL